MGNKQQSKMSFTILFLYHVFLWKLQNSLTRSVHPTIKRLLRTVKKDFKETVTKELKEHALPSNLKLQLIQILRYLYLNPNPDNIEKEEITKIITNLKFFLKTIKSRLGGLNVPAKEELLFKAFFSYFRNENEKSFKFLVHNVIYIGRENNRLIQLIRHLRAKEDEPVAANKEIDKKIQHFVKKNLKGVQPTWKTLKALKKEKVLEYRRLKLASNALSRMSVEEVLAEQGWTLAPAQKINKIFSSQKLPQPFDKGFDGYVGVDGNRFVYYTTNKKEIIDSVGTNTNVLRNPDWNPDADDTYCYTSRNIKGGKAWHYTIDHHKRKGKSKFSDIQVLSTMMDDLRVKWEKDSKSKEEALRSRAFLCRIADHVYPRIGSAKHEEARGTLGLFNLKVKNVSITKKGVVFKYPGKKNSSQKHLITDPTLVKFINERMANKKPKDYLFSYANNTKLVKPLGLNKYLKSLGCPVTIHRFRTYHASRLAKLKLLDRSIFSRNTSDEAKIKYLIKSMQEIAGTLGDESWKTAAKDYVDHSITAEFFKQNNLAVPKNIGKLLHASFEKETGENLYTTSIKTPADLTNLDFSAWLSERKV